MKARVQSERDCVEAFACALDANVPCVVLRQESSALIMCCVDCEEIVAVEWRTARLLLGRCSPSAEVWVVEKSASSVSDFASEALGEPKAAANPKAALLTNGRVDQPPLAPQRPTLVATRRRSA